jgi:hypothetical protein
MRKFVMAAAVAVGLVALWGTVMPLSAQHATEQAAAMSPALSKALFLCRAQGGVNHACVRALAKSLMLDAKPNALTQVSNPSCRVDQQMLDTLRQRG